MENNYPIGYETLLADFKRYQKQTPKGISMSRKKSNIYFKFTVGSKRGEYACNCTFTLDGMVSALSKAHKVSEALKTFTSESEFWEWYNREIKEVGKIENDLLTFKEAIAVVEDDFWKRKDRRGNKRVKGHPSHETSYKDTYGKFYKHLPLEKVINLKDILTTLNRWRQGTKSYKDAMSAYRALVSKNGYESVYKQLKKINSTQTEFKELQTITLEEFMEWRNEVLGITAVTAQNAKALEFTFSFSNETGNTPGTVEGLIQGLNDNMDNQTPTAVIITDFPVALGSSTEGLNAAEWSFQPLGPNFGVFNGELTSISYDARSSDGFLLSLDISTQTLGSLSSGGPDPDFVAGSLSVAPATPVPFGVIPDTGIGILAGMWGISRLRKTMRGRKSLNK